MKHFLFSMAICVAFLVSCENKKTEEASQAPEAVSTPAAQTANTPAAPAAVAGFAFESKEHDFGTINEGDVVDHTFSFTNTGAAPLLISDIRTSCGCTTPAYTKAPIMPGETGEIQVQFNSKGKPGTQFKNITIYANVAGGSQIVSIKAQVNPKAEVAGPFRNQSGS